MSTSIYSISVPLVRQMLGNLQQFLAAGATSAEGRRFDSAVLTQARLAPDMLPLAAQVRIACDAAKLGLARLAGVESPRMEDTETTLAELQDRIARTLDFVATLKPEQFEGAESRDITFPVGPDRKRTLSGEDYLRHWMIPNFHFHVVMTYALLRHNGVPLGKADYLALRSGA